MSTRGCSKVISLFGKESMGISWQIRVTAVGNVRLQPSTKPWCQRSCLLQACSLIIYGAAGHGQTHADFVRLQPYSRQFQNDNIFELLCGWLNIWS